MFVLVMAKEPVPGRVKTRLCPPCTPVEAARIAEAALADTLEAALGCGADEVVVALDGDPGDWLPAGVTVVPQLDATFDHRLAAAWAQTTGPGLQIGMDTPQVGSRRLDDALRMLDDPETDAVLGPATDGGWWAIGLPTAPDAGFHERVFVGVPMSTPDTGREQRRRLDSLGLRVGTLEVLTDVDHHADARSVAALIPDSRFAHAVASVSTLVP